MVVSFHQTMLRNKQPQISVSYSNTISFSLVLRGSGRGPATAVLVQATGSIGSAPRVSHSRTEAEEQLFSGMLRSHGRGHECNRDRGNL